LRIGKIREDVNGISGFAPSLGNQRDLLQKNRDAAENVSTYNSSVVDLSKS
jgi:hypothetical protein